MNGAQPNLMWKARARVKQALRRVSPWLHRKVVDYRNARGGRIMRATGVESLTQRYIAAQGASVASGPFVGMKYVSNAHCSMLMPKLVGSYEAELQPVIERMVSAGPARIIDVGCAEGYYAVGMARRCPNASVIAYDTEPAARALCSELAGLNGVSDRVQVRGACHPSELEVVLREPGRAIIICDCEGYESVLLDPSAAPSLARCEILVELHEMFQPGVTRLLRGRFAPTHEIREITGQRRQPGSYPTAAGFTAAEQAVAVNEFRHGPVGWMHLVPRNGSA